MNKKTKNMIIRRLRQASLASEERKIAKNNVKVAPASFQCESCGIVVYEGAKELDKAGLENFPKKIKGKTHMDHKDPVVDVYTKEFNWDTYINSLFSPVENWQCLCEECHDKKTERENSIRNKNKKKAKTSRRKNEKIKRKSKKSSKA